MSQLHADPEWMARKQERDRIFAERAASLRIDEAPLVEALSTIGFPVRSVWDLVNSSGPYTEAIPVLLEHLQKPYHHRTREGIARSLAVPDARYAWPKLVELYRNEPINRSDKIRSDAKSGLAVAVAATTTEQNIAGLVDLARDRSLGSSRLLLLNRLKRSKSPTAKQALEELAADPDLAKEIASWRPRKRSPESATIRIDKE